MSMMPTGDFALADREAFRRRHVDLPGEIRHSGDSYPCRVSTLSAAGVELEVEDAETARKAFAPDAVIVLPSLGQYKARRAAHGATKAAFLFDLTEFSLRALDALIADRFAD